jgi:hypothetical protein
VRVPPRACVRPPHAASAHVSRAPVQRASCAGGALAARMELEGKSSRRAFATVRRACSRNACLLYSLSSKFLVAKKSFALELMTIINGQKSANRMRAPCIVTLRAGR